MSEVPGGAVPAGSETGPTESPESPLAPLPLQGRALSSYVSLGRGSDGLTSGMSGFLPSALPLTSNTLPRHGCPRLSSHHRCEKSPQLTPHPMGSLTMPATCLHLVGAQEMLA